MEAIVDMVVTVDMVVMGITEGDLFLVVTEVMVSGVMVRTVI